MLWSCKCGIACNEKNRMLGCIRAVARPGRSLIRPTLAPSSSSFPSPFGFFLFKNKESSTDPSTYPADGGVHHHGPCSGWNSMTSSLRWAAGQFCSSRSKHTHFDQLCHFFRPPPLSKKNKTLASPTSHTRVHGRAFYHTNATKFTDVYSRSMCIAYFIALALLHVAPL